MSRIKLILWDLDATLIDNSIAERNAIIKCFEFFDLGPCSNEFLDAYPAVNIKWWTYLETTSLKKEDIIVGRFDEMLKRFGYDNSIARDFNERYMIYLADEVTLLPEAMETVTSLKGKVIQAIASNGVERTQYKKLQKVGLDKIMDRVFISDVLGADKPKKEFFDAVLNKFKDLKKDEIMIVGDSLTTDMAGGNNAGIICCWYNPNHKERSGNLKIDYEISVLSKVPEVLNELAQSRK